MCYHCNSLKKRYTIQRRKYGITQTAGLCLWCHKKRGSSYAAQGWKVITEDVIMRGIAEDIILKSAAQ